MNMESKIIAWLFEDQDTGVSSKAMAAAVLGYDSRCKWTPSDPSDFNRCLLLIEAAPEIKDHMEKVSMISKSWAQLVAHWDEIELSFINEVGRNWCNSRSAPITYKLMHELSYKSRDDS